MEFKEYSKAVMAWVDGVMQNRGADAEKTLKYCADSSLISCFIIMKKSNIFKNRYLPFTN